jgi:hypothetical protein
LLAAAWLTACAGGRGGALEWLDERSGVTLARGREPLVFARTETRYSRSARDYLYVGPVETNRQGVKEYYLWVGVATTLDRGFIAPSTGLPQTLVIRIEGEPVELPLAPWADLVRATARTPVYATAVPVKTELAARVTLQQLTLFERQPLAALSVAVEGQSAPRTYVRWGEGGGLEGFLSGRVAGL